MLSDIIVLTYSFRLVLPLLGFSRLKYNCVIASLPRIVPVPCCLQVPSSWRPPSLPVRCSPFPATTAQRWDSLIVIAIFFLLRHLLLAETMNRVKIKVKYVKTV